MVTRMAVPALGVGLLLAGIAIDRYFLPPPTTTSLTAPAAPPSRFLASFDGLKAVERHLKGVEPARISQFWGGIVSVNQGVYTKCSYCWFSHSNRSEYAEFKTAMQAIGNDIATQVSAEGGTTICKALGWGAEPSEWVYEVNGHRGVVTILVLKLNQPAPTDIPANLAVLVQMTEY
jgi:hypothetical protein